MGRGGTETDFDMFVDQDADELIGVNDGDDENQQFKTYAGQMNATSYGALPPTKDYTYEESKDDIKKVKKAESYHTLAGSQDFELQKMPKGNDTTKPSSKTQLSSSYHRLDSEPTKQSMTSSSSTYNPVSPLVPLEDEKPTKLVSEKAKAKPEKQSIDDIESFLLEDNDL